MDLEVVGRHALFFDDDATAAFVDSGDALVEWNTLLLDRYDVRHLLQNLPTSFRRRRHQQTHSSSPPTSVPSSEPELDHDRYLDLPPPSDEQELSNGLGSVDTGAYRAVAFSYGNPDDSTDQKNADAGLGYSGFRPPFPVPESLLENLPPTEKVHQIIARTAVFVGKHGGQSEIVLRVKQGDNPTFGFLMPDHHLHAYFRFLVDHQELMNSEIDGKSQEEDKKADTAHNQTGGVGGGGALSLLGSIYGSGEEEDLAAEDAPESKENASEETYDPVNATVSHGSEQTEFSLNVVGKDEEVPKHPLPSSKEKAPASKRNRIISTVKAGTTSSMKKEGDILGSLCAAVDMSQSSTLPSTSKVESLLLEPPSDLKRLVDKIVEFILKNGKEFEAVVVEQDSKHGRFPFLLPSNQYHSYYLKVLQKAQQSRLTSKNFISGKDDSMGHGADKKTALSKESDTASLGSAGHDMPYDSDRKERFKMVLGKSKKDGQDPPSKPTQPQFRVSVDAAAAILQAATRGTKNPSLEILPKTSLNGITHGLSSEGGQASSFGSFLSSRPQSFVQKPDPNGEPSVSVPVAKVIAKTAALAAASEADSSEACLTREQKLKAERLKRAKMFAAMIKSGAAPSSNEPLRGLSVEPPESGVSGSNVEVVNLVGKEREGSSVPFDVDTSDKIEKSERKYYDDGYNERRSRRKYRSRSTRHEEEVEEEKEEEEDEERDHKHPRKKRRSHHSSHHSRDRHKHRKIHSSSKDRESRHRHKNDSSSNDEHQHRSSSVKHRRKSHSEKEVDLEEGEISSKFSDQSKTSVGDGASREASLDLSNSYQDGRAPSLPSVTTEVSDDLRAKIRAMLATFSTRSHSLFHASCCRRLSLISLLSAKLSLLLPQLISGGPPIRYVHLHLHLSFFLFFNP